MRNIKTHTAPLQCPKLNHLGVSQLYCVLLPFMNKKPIETKQELMSQVLSGAQQAQELVGRVSMRTHFHRGDLSSVYIF